MLREGLDLGVGADLDSPEACDESRALQAAQPVTACLLVSGPAGYRSGLQSPSCHRLSSPRQAARDKDPLLK